MQDAKFDALVRLITKKDPPDPAPFIQCLARSSDLKNGLFRIFDEISRNQIVEYQRKLFILAANLINARNTNDPYMPFDDVLLLHSRLVSFQPKLLRFDAYLTLEQVFRSIYEPLTRGDMLRPIEENLRFATTGVGLVAMAVLGQYRSSAVSLALRLIDGDLRDSTKLFAMSLITRNVYWRGSSCPSFLEPAKIVPMMEDLLKSEDVMKEEAVLHMLTSLQHVYDENDGPEIAAHFMNVFILKILDNGSDFQAELVADLMAALKPTNEYPNFNVAKQLSSLLIVSAKRIRDYHSSYCQKVVNFARLRSNDPFFRMTLEGMPYNDNMYATALQVAIKCELLDDYLDLFYPSRPEPEFMAEICHGVEFLSENNMISEPVARKVLSCLFGMTTVDQSTSDESLNKLLLSTLKNVCVMFPEIALGEFLVVFPDVNSVGMLATLASMFRNEWKPEILPQTDYLNSYLVCVAVVLRIIVSPKIKEEEKNELIWFLTQIEPVSQDMSHRTKEIYPNVISVQDRFIPDEMMPNYIEILESLYSKCTSYCVNWAGIKDIPLDKLMRLCERVNDPERFFVDQFVAFYDTRLLVSPNDTCQYLLGITKEKTKGFALTRKRPPIQYSRGILRVMTFMCRFLQTQPTYFEDLMKVAFVKLTTDEVVELRKECRDFVEAFSLNQRFQLQDRKIIYNLLGIPMYIEFCGGLLLKVDKKDETVVQLSVAWMEELAVCEVTKAHNRRIVEGLFDYYANDHVVEIMLNGILVFFEGESKWAQLDFLKTIAICADERKMHYTLLNLDVVFKPARYLLSTDETLRVAAAEYFMGLFHIPRPQKPDTTHDVESTENPMDDFLKYYMMPAMPSDRKETFVRIFEKVFDQCDTLFCERIFMEIAGKVSATIGEKLDLHHVLIVRALTASKINFQSPKFEKLVVIPPNQVEVFSEAVAMLTDLAVRNLPSFVALCVSHSMTPLLSTVIRRISMSATQRNLLADHYIAMIRDSEEFCEKNSKFEFLQHLVRSDAAKENDTYIGKLIMIALLLLGQHYQWAGSKSTSSLASIFANLTNHSGKAINWDKSIPTLDKFSKTVGAFATIITHIPTAQAEQLFLECQTCVNNAKACQTVRTMCAFLVHSVRLFSSYGSYNAVRRRNFLGSLLSSMFEKAIPRIGYDVTYIFNHTLTRSDILALANEQRKKLFGSVLQLLVQLDSKQRTEAADIVCFILPLIDIGSARLGEVVDVSKLVSALQGTMNDIPYTATILHGLEYLAEKGIDFRGDPAKTKLSNPSLLYHTCHGLEVIQATSLNVLSLFLKCRDPDEAIDEIPRKVPQNELIEACPRVIEEATAQTIHLPWMKLLCSLAKNLVQVRDRLDRFYAAFFDLCVSISCDKSHECYALAMDAIASFA